MSESFNSAIRHARRKPIITMLEEIRLFVMERIYTQRVEGMEWDLLICPTIRKRIEDLKVKQREVFYFNMLMLIMRMCY